MKMVNYGMKPSTSCYVVRIKCEHCGEQYRCEVSPQALRSFLDDLPNKVCNKCGKCTASIEGGDNE